MPPPPSAPSCSPPQPPFSPLPSSGPLNNAAPFYSRQAWAWGVPFAERGDHSVEARGPAPSKRGPGNQSNCGEHVLGGWIGKQQAGPYVGLCHKDSSAYLPWQTGLPETINLARFIKIKHWPPTSPLGVRQMPRSDSIDLKCSLLHFWKESKAWISLGGLIAAPVWRGRS